MVACIVWRQHFALANIWPFFTANFQEFYIIVLTDDQTREVFVCFTENVPQATSIALFPRCWHISIRPCTVALYRVFVFMRRKLKCSAFFFSHSRLHVIHKSQQPTKQTSHIHTHSTTTTVAYYFFTNSWQHHFVNINEIRSNKFYLFKLNCEFYWLTAGYLYLCAIDIFNV